MTVALADLQAAWTRSVVPLMGEESIVYATVFGDAVPVELRDGWLLLLEFPPERECTAAVVNCRKARSFVRRKLFELTGEEISVGIKLKTEETPCP
jgi:hypothetical protein